MKNLKIRWLATPLIIGAGIFVATTGLLMFFVTADPFRFAHEIVGVGFAVGIVLHILSNWRPFTRYFSQKSAAGIIALGWVVGISLVTTSAMRGEEDAEDRVVDQIEQTSIQLLAPVVGVEVGALVDRLKADGLVVDNPEMSIEQLADKHGTDTEDILLLIFR